MLYAGLDLSRKRLDVHVLDEEGTTVEVMAVRPDADALRTLAAHVPRYGQEVTAVIESMTGARFVVARVDILASSPKPSGTSSPRMNPSLRQAPLCCWSLDGARIGIGPPAQASQQTVLRR